MFLLLLIDAERVFLYAFLPNLAIHLFCDRVLPKNFFIIIEHNLDVIKLADHIIDIGPEGGKHGGEIIATGTPEELIKSKKSLTAKFLKKEME